MQKIFCKIEINSIGYIKIKTLICNQFKNIIITIDEIINNKKILSAKSNSNSKYLTEGI